MQRSEPRTAVPPVKKSPEERLNPPPAPREFAGIKEEAAPAEGPVAGQLAASGAAAATELPEEQQRARRDASGKTVRRHWNEFLGYVRERKEWMASALRQADEVELKGDELVVHFLNPADCRLLKNREHITLLTEFALDFFQENFRISFVLPDSDACAVDPIKGITPQQERQALANDSLVLTAVDVFNGEVGDIRVGPRYRTPIVEPEPEERLDLDESD